ncbi:MAG: TonB-dependent receptor [Sulfuricaulis sp.]|uniref:TonB-dependent receptor n=1 Tax=Sulfuricaulis sp. TaxID=2003553 RepID=UPI0025E0E4CB|nr:TonB-dependent receptor [Sulfuricaulis sp.]MCR4346820.1 TonB-dependent receptor [Sulfuricaulis sp.]
MKSAFYILNVSFAICTFPFYAMAATTLEHPAVIVTSTRMTDDNARLPASVSVITAESISRSPASTLPELLALEAGVATRSLYGNHAARATVDMRGFGAASTQNTLILLDGRRLNDIDLSAVDFAAIPVESIERIEIIRGGGGVLYGDGAAGGAINIITKQPGRRGTSGSIIASLESHQSHRLDAAFSHGQDLFAANAFVSSINADGYRRNNELKQNNLQTDLRWFHDRGEWFLKLGADDQSVRLPGERRVDPGAGVDELNNDRRGTSRPRDYANQNGGSLTMGHSHFLSADQELIIDLGYRKKNQKAFFDDYAFGGAFANYYDTNLATVSLTPRLKIRHRLFDRPGTLVTGVDYYHSQYDSDRSLNPSTASTPIHRLDVNQTSLAVYGQDTSEISDRSLLTLGGRWQRVKMQAHDDFNPGAPGGAFGSGAPERKSSDTEHILDMGLRHRLNETLSIFGKIGRSVRFATIDEFFQTDSNSFLQTFSPLKPQTAESLDLGADYAQGDTRLGVGIYRMNFRNEIHFNSATFANENLDPTRRHGMTVSAEKRITESSRVTADYAYTRSTFRSGTFAGNEVPLVSQNTGSLAYSWASNRKLTVSAAARYTGEKHFDNDQTNTFQKIPAITTVDIKLMRKIDAWKWQAAVNNLFNRKAFDYGVRSTSSSSIYNAYPLPERFFSFSLGRDF